MKNRQARANLCLHRAHLLARRAACSQPRAHEVQPSIALLLAFLVLVVREESTDDEIADQPHPIESVLRVPEETFLLALIFGTVAECELADLLAEGDRLLKRGVELLREEIELLARFPVEAPDLIEVETDKRIAVA